MYLQFHLIMIKTLIEIFSLFLTIVGKIVFRDWQIWTRGKMGVV